MIVLENVWHVRSDRDYLQTLILRHADKTHVFSRISQTIVMSLLIHSTVQIPLHQVIRERFPGIGKFP